MLLNKMISVLVSFFLLFSFVNLVRAEETTLKTAEQYYLDGIYYYSKRSYESAKEQFEALSKNFPYSKQTRNALILEAFTSYLNKEYDKIDGIYEVYSKLYPDDKYADYMLFLKAMSYYIQIRDVERGGREISMSKMLLEMLVEKYPHSKYFQDSKEKIAFLTKLQQFNSLTIGDFLYKNDFFISAIRQYISLLKKYNNVMNSEFEEVLLCRIIETSKSIQNDEFYNFYYSMLKKKRPNSKCL